MGQLRDYRQRPALLRLRQRHHDQWWVRLLVRLRYRAPRPVRRRRPEPALQRASVRSLSMTSTRRQ